MVLVDVIESNQEEEQMAVSRSTKLLWLVLLIFLTIGLLWFAFDLPGRDGIHVVLTLALPFWVWWMLKSGLVKHVG